MTGTSAAGAVKSADRTLTILEYLANSPTRKSQVEMATDLNIPRSSLHGLLATLRARRWIGADDTGLRFGIGSRALLVGTAYLATDEMISLSAPHLDELSRRLGETIHMGCLDGDRIIYLAKRDAIYPLRLVSAVGVRLPAYATALGKAILSELEPDALAALLPGELERITPSTLTRDQLVVELQQIKRVGYAIDREESTTGVQCYGVAIGPRDPADHGISCSVPLARLNLGVERTVIDALQNVAYDLRAVATSVQSAS